jgi:hypothetical protein
LKGFFLSELLSEGRFFRIEFQNFSCYDESAFSIRSNQNQAPQGLIKTTFWLQKSESMFQWIRFLFSIAKRIYLVSVTALKGGQHEKDEPGSCHTCFACFAWLFSAAARGDILSNTASAFFDTDPDGSRPHTDLTRTIPGAYLDVTSPFPAIL